MYKMKETIRLCQVTMFIYKNVKCFCRQRKILWCPRGRAEEWWHFPDRWLLQKLTSGCESSENCEKMKHLTFQPLKFLPQVFLFFFHPMSERENWVRRLRRLPHLFFSKEYFEETRSFCKNFKIIVKKFIK